MRIGPSILLALGLLLFSSGALAVPVPLPPDGTEIILHGGGPGTGSEWDVQNNNGTSNAMPTGGSCNNSPGLGIEDGSLDGITDAFDHGLTLWVNNAIFVAPSPVDVTGETLTAGPAMLSGLNVTVQYQAVPSSATLRTVASFHNLSGSPISVVVSWVTNVGSDMDTGVRGTSSGDMTFTAADRWVVTSDNATMTPSDPVNTFVLFGPGAPLVTPASVSQTVFICPGPLDPEGILANYPVTVPATATRSLLFLNQFNETNGGAVLAAAAFDTTPAPGSDFVAGLSAAQLAQVLNWAFPPLPPPGPTLSAWGVLALSVLLGGLVLTGWWRARQR